MSESDARTVTNALAEVVAAELSLPPSQLALDAPVSTFRIGSLASVRIELEIEQRLDRTLPFGALFGEKTLAELGELLAGQGVEHPAPRRPPLARRPASATAPLASFQLPHFTLARLGRIGSETQVATMLSIRGRLDEPRLRASLRALVDRHEAFRTVIEMTKAGPLQSRVAPPDEGSWFFVERLDEPNGEDGEGPVLVPGERVRDWYERPFDLERGPVFRVVLFRRSAEAHALLFVVSHVVVDGPSFGIIARDLATFYRSAEGSHRSAEGSSAAAAPLPELPVQYADFAIWEASWRPAGLAEHAAYWTAQLAGDVPSMRRTEGEASARAASSEEGSSAPTSVPIAESLLEGIDRLARAEGATFFMVVLSALQAFVGRLTGQRDAWTVVAHSRANREAPELQSVVGHFGNGLIVRADVDEARSFRDVVRSVRNAMVEGLEHRDLRFHELLNLPPLRRARQRLLQLPHVNFDDGWLDGLDADGFGPGLEVDELGLDDLLYRADDDRLALLIRSRRGAYALKTFPGRGFVAPLDGDELSRRLLAYAQALVDAPDEPLRNVSLGEGRP